MAPKSGMKLRLDEALLKVPKFDHLEGTQKAQNFEAFVFWLWNGVKWTFQETGILKACSGFWPWMLPEISQRLYREEESRRGSTEAYSGPGR